MTRSYGLLGAIAVVALLGLLSGCGGTVLDSTKAEDTIQADLSKSLETKVKSVDCPSDIEVEKGATFTCDMTLAGGEEQVITLRIENEDADLSVTNLRPANE